ncbi:MAG: phycocyanobilin:ferredoxin oxidoreductase [Nostocales cyanobacterium 94392]|nr:phycocyanobilin:ferredoxin oxidoreductase [Nostocales cyanobacterium 94392]
MSSATNSSLREQQHPLICRLADCIEKVWHQHLDLSAYNLPAELGYVEGKLEGEKLTIENRCYQTTQFRKLHMELAKVGQMLDILHCVMFPRPEYDLPMFGCDLVGGRGQISAAIADLSPLNINGTLPCTYNTALGALPTLNFSQPRDLPEWGDIFSEFCIFIRPSSGEEEQMFLSRVENFLEIHCQNAVNAKTVSSETASKLLERQLNYCTKQQQNDKTRRVLEKAFGSDWAEYYMTTVLFDVPC